MGGLPSEGRGDRRTEMPIAGRRLPNELISELSVCVRQLHKSDKCAPLLLVGGPFSVYVRKHHHRVEEASAAAAAKVKMVNSQPIKCEWNNCRYMCEGRDNILQHISENHLPPAVADAPPLVDNGDQLPANTGGGGVVIGMDEQIRIQLEKNSSEPAEIEELVLDDCKATSISGLTEEFSNLTTLSLISVGLTSLDGLPKLVSLKKIHLCDNKLSGGLDKLVESAPLLHTVNLCYNEISDLATLAPLAELSKLAALDLLGCAVTEIDDYRDEIFALIPHLELLDGRFDDEEMSDEVDVGEDSLEEEEDSVEEEIDSGDEDAPSTGDMTKDGEEKSALEN